MQNSAFGKELILQSYLIWFVPQVSIHQENDVWGIFTYISESFQKTNWMDQDGCNVSFQVDAFAMQSIAESGQTMLRFQPTDIAERFGFLRQPAFSNLVAIKLSYENFSQGFGDRGAKSYLH